MIKNVCLFQVIPIVSPDSERAHLAHFCKEEEGVAVDHVGNWWACWPSFSCYLHYNFKVFWQINISGLVVCSGVPHSPRVFLLLINCVCRWRSLNTYMYVGGAHLPRMVEALSNRVCWWRSLTAYICGTGQDYE